jgi:hypothetical protein
MGFKYVLKNIFKLIILFISVGMLANLKNGTIEPPIAVFLIILICVNVSTTYDLGNGYYLQVLTGGSILGAFIGYLLAYMALEWVMANSHIVLGIVVMCYAINQLIETIKYGKEVHPFFTISNIFCTIMIAIEAINCFQEKSLITTLTEGPLGTLLLLVTAILILVNIFARAGHASYVED